MQQFATDIYKIIAFFLNYFIILNMDKKLIPINQVLHKQIKDYCKCKGFVMSKFVESLLDTNFNKLKGENNEQRGLQS